QGAMHEVYTGYTITHETRSITRVIRTRVYFRPMSDGEITWYISTGEPMDKAGSYGPRGSDLFSSRVSRDPTRM
ncbi:MAG TPA: Maf family protein, partial [Deltaproteobacteria bacterium]|nr:Maf family protein [Deltaproteobacteria bacterium]